MKNGISQSPARNLPERTAYHSLKWMHGQVLMARIGLKSDDSLKGLEKQAEFAPVGQKIITKLPYANALN